MNLDESLSQAQSLFEEYEPVLLTGLAQLVFAVVIFLVGKWAASLVRAGVTKGLKSRNVDPTLVGFAGNLIYAIILAFTVIAALGKIGVQTASFVAIIGAAGLAIGLALQGSLSNFAAGILLLIFRFFKVGDYVEAGGTAGIVEDIGIFTTQMRTPDNKTIIIPNAEITSGLITNYSAKPTRRVDMTFGIDYGDDIDQARQVILETLAKDERIHADPAPLVVVAALADSSVNLSTRVWVNSENFWPVMWDQQEAVKKALDAADITIPFPQHTLHIQRES